MTTQSTNTDSTKKTILTGDTPTGKMHIGHYVGSLQNRVNLQDEYNTFILSADLHAFTTLANTPEVIQKAVYDVTIGNLAAGVDPTKATFFLESAIPEIYELATIFSMLVSHNRALRNPTIKDEIRLKGLGDKFSLGFVNYPMLQAADILCVKADVVPVGRDQLPHLEQTNEIVRKFNSLYGETFSEITGRIPKGSAGKLVGIDGNAKMSKSLDNTIYLNETPENLKKKVMSMYTDPNRIHVTDPGKVEGNPVFIYHDAFNPNKEEVAELKTRYTQGKVGDVEVKEKLFVALDAFLAPIREKHNYYEENLDEVTAILEEGTKRTRSIVRSTLEGVKEKVKLLSF